MIDIKTSEEIAIMTEGGAKLGRILQTLMAEAVVGANLLTIEKRAIDLIALSGGTPSFQTVEGYKWATCLCVNDEVVHGIPRDYDLANGDILTIDVGLLYKGLHTDTAWTKVVSRIKDQGSSEKQRFLQVGEEALWKAIARATIGNRIGYISQGIQREIEGAGYSIVRSLVGHGVGRELHEEPQVPGVLKGSIETTPVLVDGMTIAIEIIYAQGKGAIVYDNTDGWTLASKDGSLTAVFEHTVSITASGPIILTRVSP